MTRTPKPTGRPAVPEEQQLRKRSFYLGDADYERLVAAAPNHPTQEVSRLVRWILQQWLFRWEHERQEGDRTW